MPILMMKFYKQFKIFFTIKIFIIYNNNIIQNLIKSKHY